MYDCIIVGAGYAGAISARRFSEEGNMKVLVIDKRTHIAGNMYDDYDAAGILVHRYGPHIPVMNEERVFRFLSRFTDWMPYHHHVLAEIDKKEVPLPINLTAIDLLYPIDEAIALKARLIEEYGFGQNIPILQLRDSDDPMIHDFAEMVFEKVFLHYTMKMWGLSPEEIDPSVTGRIPVRLSYDDRHFLHTYQVMPTNGFTKLFERMLNHPNIAIQLNTSASEVLSIDEKNHQILYRGEPFYGKVIYTGALDELFAYRFGALPYRSLSFDFETHPVEHVQDSSVLNWPDSRPQTRRTEMKRLTGQIKQGVTTTIVETPGAHDLQSPIFSEPVYPINREDCNALYQKYLELARSIPNLIPVGRLADYQYYNMEAVILRTLKLTDEELEK